MIPLSYKNQFWALVVESLQVHNIELQECLHKLLWLFFEAYDIKVGKLYMLYIYMYVCMYVCMYVYMYVCMYLYMCVCMCILCYNVLHWVPHE